MLSSVRVRTTAAAVLVVAVALLAGGFALVALVRDSLRDGLAHTAEQQLSVLVDQIEASGPPSNTAAENDRDEDPGDLDEPDELVWQITDRNGRVVATTLSPGRGLSGRLPGDDDDVRLRGADHRYLTESDKAKAPDDREYEVVVAISLEEVDDSTQALVGPLLIGLPVLLVLVGATTWIVATRALAPVEQIRREVEQITGDRLDRRVPEPRSRDEINRLARTMNQMLGRLQGSRDRQRQFVADASHELRSPLASMRQTAEVAHAHPGALPEGELADAVLEESLRMQHLVEQLLVLTRADEGTGASRSQEVDLDDLLLTEARRLRRGGLDVDATGVAAVRVQGDPSALAQVVRNLVDNAARHVHTRVSLSLHRQGAHAVMSVEDDGPGIPVQDRERVFDRFVRLDEARARDAGGSGLGLAIVREIVAAHGGTVAVEDGPGTPPRGARLVVRLPVHPSEEAS